MYYNSCRFGTMCPRWMSLYFLSLTPPNPLFNCTLTIWMGNGVVHCTYSMASLLMLKYEFLPSFWLCHDESTGPSSHQGTIHKWRHPLRREGGSAKRRHYSLSLISDMGDKREGWVKDLKKWVTSFMNGRQWRWSRGMESWDLKMNNGKLWEFFILVLKYVPRGIVIGILV